MPARDLTVLTPMQEAFLRGMRHSIGAPIKAAMEQAMVEQVFRVAEKVRPKKVRSVDTKLSFKTYQQLTRNGTL